MVKKIMDNTSKITGQYTFDWFHGNIPQWNEELKKFKGRQVQFLEIGSFEGRSATWLLENILTNPRSTITCVDTFLGSEEHIGLSEVTNKLLDRFKENTKSWEDKVNIVQGRSHAKLIELAQDLSNKYNFIYIDGSHHHDDVFADAMLSWPLLKKNGLMFFDDVTWTFTDPITGETHKPVDGMEKFLALHQGEYEETYRLHQLHIKKLV